MRKVLFIISCLLFFSGFQPSGWEIFLCLFLTLLLSVLVKRPGLPEKFGKKSILLSVVITFLYTIFVFITFGDASNDHLIFSALFTVLTMAGTFWFVLNLLNMLPKMRASLKVPEIKDNGIGKAGYFYLLIVAIINCSFLSQSSPLYPLNYWDDVNSYVTVSRALVAGKVLYKDIFDHKGPLLHFLNIPFSAFNHQSYIGVFILEVIFCFFWLILALKIMSLYIKLDRTSFIAVLPLAMLTYSVNAFHYGGSTEEYALPFLMLGLYIGLKAIKENRLPKLSEALYSGMASGFLFWMKFTLSGFYIGFIFFVIYRCIRFKKPLEILKLSAMFISGFAVITLPVLSYFAITGSMSSLYEAYFYFNIFVYSGNTVSVAGRIPYALILMFIQLGRNHILALAISLGFIYFFARRERDEIAFILITFVSSYMCLYSGEKPMFYYCFGLACFSVLGWVALIPLLKNTMSRIRLNSRRILISFLASAAFCVAAFAASDSTLIIFRDREKYPQYVFARTILDSGDPTVLNFKCLDSGIYNATDTVPDFRFFYQVNYPGNYSKSVKEPLSMVTMRKVRFVVTNDLYDLSGCGYRLIDARCCAYTDINGNVARDEYYLYELELFA